MSKPGSSSLLSLLLLIVVCISLFNKQANAQKAHLIAERDLGSGVRTDVVDKVESQLLGALELLQSYQAGEAMPLPAKFAEKRKNKFEFIRFGRRRR